MSAIEKIESQQKKLKEGSAPWVCGEQLKEICSDPACAEIVEKDLDVKEMSIEQCEKKIKAYADAHKTGNFAFVSPMKAEEIIREFYGLPEHGTHTAPKPEPETETQSGDILSLEDFL